MKYGVTTKPIPNLSQNRTHKTTPENTPNLATLKPILQNYYIESTLHVT